MAGTPDTDRIVLRVRRTIVDAIMSMMLRTAARASEHMVVPGGKKLPVRDDKLTTRSGRLLRALVGSASMQRDKSGRFVGAGVRDASMEIVATGGGTIMGEWSINVPYAAIHEYGGRISAYTMRVTPRMRSFFWARFHATKDEKWLAAARKRTINMPARTVTARPYIGPAIEDTMRERDVIVRDAIVREFGGGA